MKNLLKLTFPDFSKKLTILQIIRIPLFAAVVNSSEETGKFLLNVRKAVERLLERDPELKTADLIKKRIKQLNVTTHFE